MSLWKFWTAQANKWIIYALESYITLIVATIFFSVLFDAVFNLPIIVIWLLFVLLSVPKLMCQGKNSEWCFYLILISIFIFGIWYNNLMALPWGIIILFILWRFTSVENINDNFYDDYASRYIIFIVLSFVYFLLNSFYHFSISANTMLYSYVITLFLFLLGGMTQKLKNSPFSTELIKSFILELGYTVTIFGVFLGLYTLLKTPILDLVAFIKKGIFLVFVYIVGVIYNFFKSLFENLDPEAEEFLNKLKMEPFEDSTEIPLEGPNIIGKYLDLILIVLLVIIITYIIIKLVRTVLSHRSNSNHITEKIESIHLVEKNKRRRRRTIASNVYRKLYQHYILWIKKKTKIHIDEVTTSNRIKDKIITNYPHISNEVETITNTYQEVRYGKINPSLSERSFKDLIKKLKKEIRSFKKKKE